MDSKLKSFIISVLRKATFKWRDRSIAYNAAKVQVGEFSTGKPKYKWECAKCGGLFMSKEICVDHINPVVPLSGYKSGLDFDLNEYVERMFCSARGMQVICSTCHDIKTKEENKLRKSNKSS